MKNAIITFSKGLPLSTIKPRKPVNYVNNRDLLIEIHKSKNSYSSYTLPEYHRYDLIIDKPELSIIDCLSFALEEAQIKQAKDVRAARLTAEAGEKVLAETILTEDLIFRVMTWDHIPVAPKEVRKSDAKKKTAKEILIFNDDELVEDNFIELEDIATKAEVDDAIHVRVNFPPFQHFKLDPYTHEFRCVGKSHWIGGIENGHFSVDHGNLTNNLAKMFMVLCSKYAMKYNWRGYSYRDEMEASAILQLTYVGLRFNEAKSNNPFSYYTTATTNSFCRVLNLEKKGQNLRDDILEMNNLAPSFSRQTRNAGSQQFTK